MAPSIPPTSYVTGENMYENMLDLLVQAKINRNNPARGESMRFFNQAYDSGAMKDFVKPEHPLNASAREIDSSVFAQTRNDPAIQNLGNDDILFTLSRNSPDAHPIGYASYYPVDGWALHQVDLPPDPFLRAMAAASSTYNIPAVDLNMERLLEDFGGGNPNPTYDVSATVANLPESIRPDVLNFYYPDRFGGEYAAYVNATDGAGRFAFDSDQAMFFNQEALMNAGNYWPSTTMHESGHILDRGLAGVMSGAGSTDPYGVPFTNNTNRNFVSEQDSYRENVDKDLAMGSIRERLNIPENMPLYFSTSDAAVNLDEDFFTDYSLDSSAEDVEDFAERFTLYLMDRDVGWAMEDVTGTKKWRFAELFPWLTRYFDGLLRQNAVMDALIPSRS